MRERVCVRVCVEVPCAKGRGTRTFHSLRYTSIGFLGERVKCLFVCACLYVYACVCETISRQHSSSRRLRLRVSAWSASVREHGAPKRVTTGRLLAACVYVVNRMHRRRRRERMRLMWQLTPSFRASRPARAGRRRPPHRTHRSLDAMDRRRILHACSAPTDDSRLPPPPPPPHNPYRIRYRRIPRNSSLWLAFIIAAIGVPAGHAGASLMATAAAFAAYTITRRDECAVCRGQHRLRCGACDGTGWHRTEHGSECAECDGVGSVPCPQCDAKRFAEYQRRRLPGPDATQEAEREEQLPAA